MNTSANSENISLGWFLVAVIRKAPFEIQNYDVCIIPVGGSHLYKNLM